MTRCHSVCVDEVGGPAAGDAGGGDGAVDATAAGLDRRGDERLAPRPRR